MIDQDKDWLAREIKYESKISAWDLDEPNKVKRLHEDNCPREKLEKQHSKYHQGNEDSQIIQSRTINSNIKTINVKSPQAKKLVIAVPIFVVLMYLLFILIFILNIWR